MVSRRTLLAAIFVSSMGAPACSGAEDTGVTSLYVVPESLDALNEETFFDHPWPSDMRLENGSPRYAGYYNPRQVAILAEYIDSMKSVLDGFSPASAGFLRFTGNIDPLSLPLTPTAALSADASVQLVDVDPASPERGQRRPISLRWQREEGVYWRASTLAFMPTFGFPLRPRTRYALVVTDSVRAEDGGAVIAGAELRQLLGLETASGAVEAGRAVVLPAAAELEAAGIPRSRIAHLAVFTTNDPTAELFAVRDHVRATVPPPVPFPGAWKVQASKPDYDEYVGVYGPSPNYQVGALPFQFYGDGGQFNIVDGQPAVVDTFHLRFSLAVPDADGCPMPAAGYPIALYAHGTGGDYRSYIFDQTARVLAARCIASMGVDQIFHGTRPGADAGQAELLFFNFQNITAARTNSRQGAIDEVQRARLFTESHAVVPAGISLTGAEIRFDASRLLFFGHSQGGLNGPPYLAADDSAVGAVLSGASSVMSITLLEKTMPSPSVAAVVKSVFLALRADEYGELDSFHPAISLAQSIVDAVDPIHYARHIALEPRPGFAPKSIYMTEGINPDGTGDSYAPPHGIEAHAIAMGLPLELPFVRPILELEWGGPQPVAIPLDGLAGNLAGGAASGVLGQWAVPADSDGHFVIFDVPAARDQAADFLRALVDEPAGRVPAP
jgi:hypothetical protein